MQHLNVDLHIIFGIWMVGAVVMVPLLAVAARFGVVPLLDAFSRMKRHAAAGDWADEVNERLQRMEARIHDISEGRTRSAATGTGGR